MARWYYFFTVIILALLFKHIFKLTFQYVQSSPFSQPSLVESTIEVSHDLFKASMFKTIQIYMLVRNECVFLEHMRVWYECTSCNLLCMFIYINWPTMKRVKACSYHSLSALTQLGHTFQGIQHITLAYQSQINSTLHLSNYMSNWHSIKYISQWHLGKHMSINTNVIQAISCT